MKLYATCLSATVLRGLAALAEHGRRQREDAECRAGDEESQQHQHERAAQFVVEEELQVDFLGVLQGKAEEQDKKDDAGDGRNKFHR